MSMPYLSKQLPAKVKPSKFAADRGPQTPRSTHSPAVTIKAEPVDTDENLRKRLSSPIVITSSDEEVLTPKAKPAKGRNFPSSLTKKDFVRASKPDSSSGKLTPWPTIRPTPLGKGKEIASETEERFVDQRGLSQPLSETTVYLEDM
jgi:hypothetical protein